MRYRQTSCSVLLSVSRWAQGSGCLLGRGPGFEYLRGFRIQFPDGDSADGTSSTYRWEDSVPWRSKILFPDGEVKAVDSFGAFQ